MPELRIYALGPPRIEVDGQPMETSRHKAIALLVYLAVAGERQRRDSLAGLLWPDYEQASAYAYLRRALWEVNDSLGKGWLDADRDEVGLSPDADIWLDVAEFRKLLATLRTHGHAPHAVCPQCREPLEEAAALYRGDFLEGFSLRDSAPFDDWQRYVAEGLRLALGEVLPRLVIARGQAREVDAALEAARRWLSLDSLNEEAHRQLMLLYTLNGELSRALRQYDDCVAVLQEELGVPPERKTTELAERIRRREIAPLRPTDAVSPSVLAGAVMTDNGTAAAGPAAPAVPTDGTGAQSFPLHNLPPQLTPFVGRTAELEELDRLLADPAVRLLSILAVGGMGKTRVAIEAAAQTLERLAHGVVYVPLAPLQSPASVVPTIAEALDLPPRESTSQRETATQRESISQKEQVLEFLSEKSMLLVLDNFEHLLEAAPLAQEILRAAPQVKMLVTSRVPLAVQGEHRYHLGGMDFPSWETPEDAPDYGAVKLFVQGARRAQPGFKLDRDDLAAVVRICRLVEGMPLGILLAAGWVELLSPAEIAAEIERSLDFLESTLQDLPERHRSLRPVLDHAWSLLSPGEQQAFTCLSVFRGSFTRQAAQEVSGASLRELMSLVNKSLLQRLADGRFSMHELLRQEAEEKLAGDPNAFDEARDRHSAWYCRFLASQLPAMKSAKQMEAARAVEQDVENTRLAWNWAAIRGRSERLAQAIEPLGVLFSWRWRYEEGKMACEFAADALSPDREDERVLYGYILAWQAAFNMYTERREDADVLIARSLAVLEQPTADVDRFTLMARAFAYNVRGRLATWARSDLAQEFLERSLALYQQANDPWWSAELLQMLGFNAWVGDDLARTAHYFQQSLRIRRALQDQMGLAGLLNSLASLAGFDRGLVDEAVGLFQESADLYLSMGDVAGKLMSLGQQQASARLQGLYQEALDLIQQQVALAEELGDKGAEMYLRMVLGEVRSMLGNYGAAEADSRAVLSYQLEVGLIEDENWGRWTLAATLLGLGEYAEVRAVLKPGVAGLQDSSGGRALLGRLLGPLARAELGLGRTEEAWKLAQRAVSLLSDQHYFWLLEAMAAAAAVLAVQGHGEQALEIYALLNRHAAVAKSRWYQDVFGRLVEEAGSSLSPQARAEAEACGQAGDLWEAARALLA